MPVIVSPTPDVVHASSADHARSAGTGNLLARVHTSRAEIVALRSEWDALRAAAPGATVFQDLEVVLSIADAEGQAGGSLAVVVVRDRGRLAFLLPLSIGLPSIVRAGLRLGRIAGDPVAQYSEALAEPGADVPALMRSAIRALRADAIADALLLRRVRADGTLAAAGDLLRPVGPALAAPFFTLGPGGRSEALAHLSKQTRRALTKRRRAAEARGDLRFETFAGDPSAQAALTRILDMKRAWLADRGEISQMFRTRTGETALLVLAGRADGPLRVSVLSLDGRIIAGQVGFEENGRHHSFVSSYDPAESAYSPGTLALEAHLADLAGAGVRIYDHLAPDSPHKRLFATGAVDVRDRVVGITPLGTAYVQLVYGVAKPLLKSAWERLPARLREPLARHLRAGETD